ncbi:MAG: outer membrane beta-barrel protein [Alistipes sp.]|nr:outer membrane beta-barrel protein [Alistipes sp.]
MKNLYQLILAFVMVVALSATAYGRQNDSLKGRVVNQKGEPVSYATVVLMKGGDQVTGTTTDDSGCFYVNVKAGEYHLLVEFVGYQGVERDVKIAGVTDLGEIVLTESATEIDEVVVKAQMIRREADRFVVDVANSPSAIGKNGEELLRQSPGVWVKDDGISILGAGGTKVFINDREIKLSGEDLVRYIKSFRAEDIAKIEVLPQTGADHDADSSGGIIYITLRRRLDNGVMGSVSMQTNQGKYMNIYSPSATVNAHLGRFDVTAAGWYNNTNMTVISKENTIYHDLAAEMNANSDLKYKGNDYGANLSAVAEINPRQSVGFYVGYDGDKSDSPITSETVFAHDAGERINKSDYLNTDVRKRLSATLNYIFKSDSLGSTLKFIADYNQSSPRANNDYHTSISEGDFRSDSLYFDRSNSTFRIATAQLARERHFSPHWTLRYGAKYTYNEINSDAIYRYQKGGAWVPSTAADYNIHYAENIGALYGVASMHYGRWSAVVGLRGEYTYTNGRETGINQNYLSLFPNANLSYALDKQGKHSLVAQYSRTIARPGFWALTPNRLPISDYSYQMGNPLLKPSYNDKLSLTAVFAYKYTVTFMMQMTKDYIQQMFVSDATDPRIKCMMSQNMPQMNQYVINVNIPLTLTKWWDWNTNIMGAAVEQRMTTSSPIETNYLAQASSIMTFKLPKKFYVDVDYWCMSRTKVANLELAAHQSAGIAIKKLIKDAWTLQCAFQQILPQRNLIITQDKDFCRKMNLVGQGQNFNVRLAVTYKFQSGKAFRAKGVESGATEEKTRM